jgi:hypothetical protein
MNSQLRRSFKCWAGNRLHGRDDAFYKARFGATLWAAPGVLHEHGLIADRELRQGAPKRSAGCSVFDFRKAKRR